ncbi:hypothetical protein [Fibrobacter sp.]|uniref:hypothetical protein n=1 Tax=Fibrobacter sp. TaxID=35828 RepID=UPI00388F7751
MNELLVRQVRQLGLLDGTDSLMVDFDHQVVATAFAKNFYVYLQKKVDSQPLLYTWLLQTTLHPTELARNCKKLPYLPSGRFCIEPVFCPRWEFIGTETSFQDVFCRAVELGNLRTFPAIRNWMFSCYKIAFCTKLLTTLQN